jgi:hypothetical protein
VDREQTDECGFPNKMAATLAAIFHAREALSRDPGFNLFTSILALPCFQSTIIPALRLNDLSAVRVFINFHQPSPASFFLGLNRVTLTAIRRLRIKDANDLTQAVAVLTKQVAEFGFKLNFFLKASVIFQGFKLGELSGELLFEFSEFSETRHMELL